MMSARMVSLPIVIRELRICTAQKSTYWSRVAAGAGGAVVVLWMLGTLGAILPPAVLGGRLFRVLAHLAFLCGLFPGVLLTADCLSEEKRNRTLGLLFLTQLNGGDVVLGKLAVTSLRAGYGLLAVLPMLAVSFFLGGVTVGEFWRVVAVLLSVTVLSLAIGMLASAWLWKAHHTMVMTLVAMLAITYGIPWAGDWLFLLSPATAFRCAFASAYPIHAHHFLGSLVMVNVESCLCLVLASWLAPRCWTDDARRAFPGHRSPRRRLRQPRRRIRREGGAGAMDILIRSTVNATWLWIALGVVFLVELAAAMNLKANRWSPLTVILAVFGLHLLLMFWVAWESSWSLFQLRQSNLLEQVLTTPFQEAQLVASYRSILLRQLRLFLLAIGVFDLTLAATVQRWFVGRGNDGVAFLTLLATLILLLVFTVRGLVRMGLWRGLVARTMMHAVIVNLCLLVLVPTGVFLAALLVVLRSAGPGGMDASSVLTVLYLLIGTTNAYVCETYAENKLNTEFRLRAATRDSHR